MPDVEGLAVVLKEFATLPELDEMFIVLDALDECPEDMRNSELIPCLEQLQECTSSKLHLLVTSRPNPDITGPLTDLLTSLPAVYMEGANFDTDIRIFVEDKLAKDRTLKVFQETWKEEIRTKVQGANGM